MADWHMTSVTFTGRKPTPVEVERLNRALKAVDYDALPVTENGIELQNWRSPFHSLEALLAFFVRMGFECTGRRYPDVDNAYLYGATDVVGKLSDLDAHDVQMWDEAYWSEVSPDQKLLETHVDKHRYIVSTLNSEFLTLQDVVKEVVEDGEDELSLKLQQAMNFIYEVREVYAKKVSGEEEALRSLAKAYELGKLEVNNGKVD